MMKKKILTALLLICFSKASCAPAKGDDGERVLLFEKYGFNTIQLYLDVSRDPDEGVGIMVAVVPREDKDDRFYFEKSIPLFYDRSTSKVSLDLSVDGFKPEIIIEALCLGQQGCAVLATSKLLGRLNRPKSNNSSFTVIQNAIRKARKKAQRKKRD